MFGNTCDLSARSPVGEVLLYLKDHLATWKDPQQMYTEEAWGHEDAIKSSIHFCPTNESQKVNYFYSVRSRSNIFTALLKMNFWQSLKRKLLFLATFFWQCPSTQLIHLKGLSGCRLWQSLHLSSARAVAWIYGKETKERKKILVKKCWPKNTLVLDKLFYASFRSSTLLPNICVGNKQLYTEDLKIYIYFLKTLAQCWANELVGHHWL